MAEVEPLFRKKELQRAPVPSVEEVTWELLEFWAWFDKHEQVAMVVFEESGQLKSLVLEKRPTTNLRPTAYLCSWCASPQQRSGIASFCYHNKRKESLLCHMLCADLACSAYIRGSKKPTGVLYGDRANLERKQARITAGLGKFWQQAQEL